MESPPQDPVPREKPRNTWIPILFFSIIGGMILVGLILAIVAVMSVSKNGPSGGWDFAYLGGTAMIVGGLYAIIPSLFPHSKGTRIERRSVPFGTTSSSRDTVIVKSPWPGVMFLILSAVAGFLGMLAYQAGISGFFAAFAALGCLMWALGMLWQWISSVMRARAGRD